MSNQYDALAVGPVPPGTDTKSRALSQNAD